MARGVDEYTPEENAQLAAWLDTEHWREFSEKDRVLGTAEAHPSYGIVGISRISGNTALFESEVKHMYYIALRIKEAERWQDGTKVRVHGRRELIEIYLTEAQFAQLITSANIGDGVPCTLHYVAGDRAEGKPYLYPRWGGRPEPPAPERFEKKFHEEAGERAGIISENLENLNAELQKMVSGEVKPGKGNLSALLAKVQSAQQQINSNSRTSKRTNLNAASARNFWKGHRSNGG